MTTAAASIVFFLLLTVAIAHLLWAIGSPWPIRDPQLLARTVIGRPGVDRVPRIASLWWLLLVMPRQPSARRWATQTRADCRSPSPES